MGQAVAFAAIASNAPESIAGAQKMREAGFGAGRVMGLLSFLVSAA